MQTRELSVKQQLFIIFLVCFLTGIVAANFLSAESFEKSGTLTRYFLKQFQYTQVNFYGVLWQVCCSRIPVFLFLVFVGLMRGGKWFYLAFAAWSGFAYGYFCVLAIGAFGSGGLLLCIVALFPQFLLYVPVYLGLVVLCVQQRRRDVWHSLAVYLVLFLLLCAGMLLESYINPIILQKILKIF